LIARKKKFISRLGKIIFTFSFCLHLRLLGCVLQIVVLAVRTSIWLLYFVHCVRLVGHSSSPTAR